jgi:hypothetical protein
MTRSADEHPGVREGHLLRKKDNPLFAAASRKVSPEALADARRNDGAEREQFVEQFQALVQRAVALDPNTPSETILELKEQLDHSYQRACGLPGDQSHIKDAIRKLVAVIMRAVRSGIGNDAHAARQLDEEDMARQTHYELQEVPLVAALTHPESPIATDELIPSLLSEDDASLERCLILFDDSQLATICHTAEDYLQDRDPERQLTAAWRRLDLICAHYCSSVPGSRAN